MSSRDIVLITGANTGIGLETVKALLQSSKAYHILLGSRTLSKGEDAVAQLKSEFPKSESTVETVQVDIESDESIGKLYEVVEGKVGRVDVLINNAGKYSLLRVRWQC
jgi:NAD(P)-dependent dehydrogenase (short-subunit alcohol dehydrogenase family)